jgi:hypothetical protein
MTTPDPILPRDYIPNNINGNRTEEYIRDCIAERQFEKDSNDSKIFEETPLCMVSQIHIVDRKSQNTGREVMLLYEA